MSYDPALSTIRDQIRSAVGDTSNDPTSEYLIDETYDAYLEMELNWKRAAARIAEAIWAKLDQKIKSYSAQGDFSVTYRDVSYLKALAARWRSEADDEDAEANADGPKLVTITSDYLTGWSDQW